MDECHQCKHSQLLPQNIIEASKLTYFLILLLLHITFKREVKEYD